jgi:hypothetical protein
MRPSNCILAEEKANAFTEAWNLAQRKKTWSLGHLYYEGGIGLEKGARRRIAGRPTFPVGENYYCERG